MKTKLITSSLIAAVALFGALAIAGAQATEEAKTVTGCLNPAEEAGFLALSIYEGGEKTKTILVAKNDDVAKHAENHTVELTGKMTKEGGKDVFVVESVKHISATCDAATE